ncbi:MAG: hypothetical protein M3186_13595 [Actinomycetota bacterium]|nr:hypothetical protein [Actinomycetota bacterium]
MPNRARGGSRASRDGDDDLAAQVASVEAAVGASAAFSNGRRLDGHTQAAVFEQRQGLHHGLGDRDGFGGEVHAVAGGVEVGDGDDLGRISGEGNRKWQHTAASGAEHRVDALRCCGLDTFGQGPGHRSSG